MKRCAILIVLLSLATLFFAAGDDPPSPKMKILPGKAEQNLLHKVEPVYPQMARIAHVQGDVILQAVINQKGKVANLKALSGHPILIQAALDAVRQWEYKPFLLNGAPVEVETKILIRFHL